MYEPNFTITPRINSAVAEIERLRTIVERSRILPTKEVVLRQRASVEATRSSTGIEGNPLTEKEVELVLAGQKVSASEHFITEVVNYKKALSFIEKFAQNGKPITSGDILSVHSIVMKGLLPKEKVGVFRKTPIYIVDIIGGKDNVRYQGPVPHSVANLLKDLLVWLVDEAHQMHPLLAAGIFHYECVSIHPFSDGNGRVTRLLTLLYLYQKGYGFRKILVPDNYYFADRQKYYRALNQAHDYSHQRAADMTPWLSYFIDGILTVARDVTQKVTAVSVTGSRRDVVTLTEEDYRIIDFISSMGSGTIDDIVSAVKSPRRTIQRRLSRLVKSDILDRIGKGPATRYRLKQTTA